MFIGHFALGMGAKKIVPSVSLGTLFLACQLADLLWPTLVLLGFESFRIQPGITVVTPAVALVWSFTVWRRLDRLSGDFKDQVIDEMGGSGVPPGNSTSPQP